MIDRMEDCLFDDGVKAAKAKRDGKTHLVEMFRSWAPFCGSWYTVFVDGVRERGAKLLTVGGNRLERSQVVEAEGGEEQPKGGQNEG